MAFNMFFNLRAIWAGRRLILLVFLICFQTQNAWSEVHLSIKDDGRSAGYVTLSWENDAPPGIYLLQQMKNEKWVTIYQGRDTASTFSGLSDNIYSFRVRNMATEGWSEVLDVRIEHHSLARALGFFVVGMILFFILCALIFLRPAHNINYKD